jgi:hypothetical protein
MQKTYGFSIKKGKGDNFRSDQIKFRLDQFKIGEVMVKKS